MSKRIIVLSDGTGNSSAKAQKTNVWRTFQAIDQSRGEQLAMYDDGVGTSSNKYLAALGGAIGWGLKRNVIHLYKFVCRNYVPGDDLFGFGFSRGAFTIRTLVDFMVREGLVDYRSEEELERNAKRAYSSYRNACFKPTLRWASPVSLFRGARNLVTRLLDQAFQRAPLAKRISGRQMRIRFLGLWDTVGAYGMPVEELRPVVNFLFWPMLWDDLHLSTQVERACHALALDDERTTFHPIVWNERHEESLIAQRKVRPDRLSQVWFAGVHSNVGGGYPEDQASLVSLDWVMSQAKQAGLVFLASHLASVGDDKSSYARLYDSRSGFGGFYRYSPRVIKTYDDTGKPIWPVIHWSVLMRMAFGSDAYAPLPLPAQFHVLAADGSLVDASAGAAMATERCGPNSPQILRPQNVALRMDLLQAAVFLTKNPDVAALELARDTVWWRRLTYFITVGLALALLSLPWSWPLFARIGDNRVNHEARGPAGSILGHAIDLLHPLIPPFAERWTDAFKAVPLSFLALAIGLTLSFAMSALLCGRIRDRIQYAWNFGIAERYMGWVRDHAVSVARASAAALVIALPVMVWALWKLGMDNGHWARSGYFQMALLAACGAAISFFALLRTTSILRQLARENAATLPSTFSLSVARYLRTQPALVSIYRWIAKVGVPIVLGLALIAGIFCIANRIVFDIAGASGYYCVPSREALVSPPTAERDIAILEVCGATRIQLTAGHRYRITLTDPDGQLFDRTEHADLGGFAGTTATHRMSLLLRRWWTENWFTPVARVGQFGNEEYPLHPAVPFASVPPYPVTTDPRYQCTTRTKDRAHCGPFVQPCAADVAHWIEQGGMPTATERRTLIAYLNPKKDGELFLYVNDAAVPLIPGLGTHFYDNNFGIIKVRVDEVEPAQTN